LKSYRLIAELQTEDPLFATIAATASPSLISNQNSLNLISQRRRRALINPVRSTPASA
jgi:hypothetical protein